MFPPVDKLDPKHVVDAAVTQVFKLKPGSKSVNDENIILLKEFLAGPLESADAPMRRQQLESIIYCYPLSCYSDGELHANLLYKSVDMGDWATPLVNKGALDEIVFQRQYLVKAPGCQHRISGAELFCSKCQQFYGCRYCHDEAELDHTLEVDDVTDIKCRYCSKVQPFGLTCSECGIQFGLKEMLCLPCKRLDYIGPNVRPSTHCDKCKRCYCSLPGDMKHCDTCNICYNVRTTKIHLCNQQQTCPVCLETLVSHFQAQVTLDCGHVMHSICRDNMISQANFKCPICSKTLLTNQDRDQYNARFAKMAAYFAITEPCYEFSTLKCLQCNHVFIDRGNITHWYCCPKCKQWNTQLYNGPKDFPIEDAIALKVMEPKALMEKFVTAFFSECNPIHVLNELGVSAEQVITLVQGLTAQELSKLSFNTFIEQALSVQISKPGCTKPDNSSE